MNTKYQAEWAANLSQAHVRFLRYVWVIALIATAALEMVSLQVGNIPIARHVVNFMLLGTGLGVFALIRRNLLFLASLATTLLPLLIIAVFISQAKTLLTPGVLLLPLSIIIGTWFFGKRAGIAICAVSVLLVLGIGLHLSDWAAADFPTLPPALYAVSCSMYLVAATAVGILSEAGHQEKASLAYDFAFIDQTTKLPNRRLFLNRLQQACEDLKSDEYAAVLLVDVDGFNLLNNALGRKHGNFLLTLIASRLAAVLPKGITLARLHMDVFGIMTPSLGDSVDDAVVAVQRISNRIHAVFRQGFELDEALHRCSVTVGAKIFSSAATPENIVHQAELSVRKGKTEGGSNLTFFESSFSDTVKKRVQIERQLHEALIKHQFELHYQAQVREGRIIGAEALLRWRNSEGQFISPAEFIPVAEDSGLIVTIGDWVMLEACRQLKAWESDPYLKQLTIAVNVSVLQILRSDFVSRVISILSRTGAEPARLKIELTESAFVQNAHDVIDSINRLRQRGLRFSIDDFGTGYSSLSYLKRLPIDQLKIDQSFIKNLLNEPDDQAITSTITKLAHDFGMEVIAEGVETHAQKDLLLSIGCNSFQGYLFAKPMNQADFEEMATSFAATQA